MKLREAQDMWKRTLQTTVFRDGHHLNNTSIDAGEGGGPPSSTQSPPTRCHPTHQNEMWKNPHFDDPRLQKPKKKVQVAFFEKKKNLQFDDKILIIVAFKKDNEKMYFLCSFSTIGKKYRDGYQ